MKFGSFQRKTKGYSPWCFPIILSEKIYRLKLKFEPKTISRHNFRVIGMSIQVMSNLKTCT